MAARKATASTMKLAGSMLRPAPHSVQSVRFFRTKSPLVGFDGENGPSHGAVRFASTKSGGKEKKSPTRLAEVQRLLYQAEERYKAGGGVEPIPKITLDHVTISYAGSGGSGVQNVNKVNTKVDMRFNVKNAHWLNERVRERIMQMEKNRINRDGEIIISSKKSRALKNNAEDAMAKLQVFTYQKKKLQAIIDAASYVPLPPSQETMRKIAKLSALAEQKQLDRKKSQSQKKCRS